MDSCDAKWYGDLQDPPIDNTAASSQAHTVASLVPPSSASSSTNIPPGPTMGSRVLCKMDSGQALDLFLQGLSPDHGGAEDTS